MTFSIQNLLAEISPDDVKFQMLDNSLRGADKNKNGDSHLKFVTSEQWGLGPRFDVQTECQGIVLWLDRQEVKNIMADAGPSPVGVDPKHESYVRMLRTSLQYLVEKGVESRHLLHSDMAKMLNCVEDLFPK